MDAPEKAIIVLGYTMTPETVREVIRNASAVHWGTHLLRWRYFDVTYEGMTYHRDALVPTALWHLLTRIDVDQAWPTGTTLEHLHDDARVTIAEPGTEISVYGYSRTAPPRLQWGFFNAATGIAVVDDAEADRIATVFQPEAGALFLQRQVAAVQSERRRWGV